VRRSVRLVRHAVARGAGNPSSVVPALRVLAQAMPVLEQQQILGQVLRVDGAVAVDARSRGCGRKEKCSRRVLRDGWQTTHKTALKKRGQLRRSPSSASKPEAVAG
jgi:hypothetical protein